MPRSPIASTGSGSRRHFASVASPSGREYGDNTGKRQCRSFRLKHMAAAVAAGGAAILGASTFAYRRIRSQSARDQDHGFLSDSGPEELWVPPNERPIPLSGFPNFSGLSMSRDSKKGFSKREHSEAGAPEKPVTLLFMHLWKCAGSSLRHMLRDWAELEDQSIGIVVRCTDKIDPEGKICLQDHQLIDHEVQGPYVRQHQVLAGHFTWGFQNHVVQPYVMFTTLRNPLELFVSGQQYLNRKETRRFADAIDLVEETMRVSVERHRARLAAAQDLVDVGGLVLPEGQGGKMVGFIYRLVEPEVISTARLERATQAAMSNLDTFWLVGVIEQYKGFMAVLQRMMDPFQRHRKLWKRYAVGRYNTSPNGAGAVLAGIALRDPGLVAEFNESLSQQWKVYDYATHLYKDRCQQILSSREKRLCAVPTPPGEYTLSSLQRETLHQEQHPMPSFDPEEVVRAQDLWAMSELAQRVNSTTATAPRADEAWAFFQSHGFDLADEERREHLWSRLGLEGVFHANGPWPEGFDWQKAREEGMSEMYLEEVYQAAHPDVASFSIAEIVRAKQVWAEYSAQLIQGGEGKQNPRPDDVWLLFEERGFDLADAERRDNLWERLGLADVFHASGPWPEDHDWQGGYGQGEAAELSEEELYQDQHPGVVSYSVPEMVLAKQLWRDFNASHPIKASGASWSTENVSNFFDEHAFDLSEAQKRDNLWARLGLRPVYSGAALNPETYDWKSSRLEVYDPAACFSETEVERARLAWEEFKSNCGPSEPVDPAHAWDFFSSRGFNMADDVRRENLWVELGIEHVFHPAGPLPRGAVWENFDWDNPHWIHYKGDQNEVPASRKQRERFLVELVSSDLAQAGDPQRDAKRSSSYHGHANSVTATHMSDADDEPQRSRPSRRLRNRPQASTDMGSPR